jgi:copper homeostasis protein
MDGAATIAQLVQQAAGRIIIMPGSGVRAGNIVSLAKQTGAVEFHSSARKLFSSEMNYNNQNMNEQLQSVGLDAEEVQQLVAQLATL